eukprot:jgi/Tetstr1/439320/TSEL_027759.t1
MARYLRTLPSKYAQEFDDTLSRSTRFVISNELKCMKFTEGLNHSEVKKSAHLFLTEGKRKSVDVTLDILIDHCIVIISGNESLGEKIKSKNGRTPDAHDKSRLNDGASESGARSKRKSKGKMRPAE